ncbi:PaaI family thioesterase [Rufibacter roseolus]|uniref:PaaI family thioesterase n=1 Tax=Rufibacter roseolus TaxID=2817375 RepID=UPI001B315116|nr:PaaI family thioesterase [Rufibacter roseolus]
MRNEALAKEQIPSAIGEPLSGLDYFKAIAEGEIPYPPLLETLHFRAVSIQEREAIFEFQPQVFHYNSIGTVHGGVVSALLDTAMGATLHTMLPAHLSYTTLELKTNFLKAVTLESGVLRAVGKIIHKGKTTSFIQAQLLNKQGEVFAHGVGTCLIINL